MIQFLISLAVIQLLISLAVFFDFGTFIKKIMLKETPSNPPQEHKDDCSLDGPKLTPTDITITEDTQS